MLGNVVYPDSATSVIQCSEVQFADVTLNQSRLFPSRVIDLRGRTGMTRDARRSFAFAGDRQHVPAPSPPAQHAHRETFPFTALIEREAYAPRASIAVPVIGSDRELGARVTLIQCPGREKGR